MRPSLLGMFLIYWDDWDLRRNRIINAHTSDNTLVYLVALFILTPTPTGFIAGILDDDYPKRKGWMSTAEHACIRVLDECLSPFVSELPNS